MFGLRVNTLGRGRKTAGGGAITPENPGAGATTYLWLDASDATTLTTSGSEVTVWTDKSSNGFTFTPIATGPTTGSDTVNSLNALTFANTALTSANNTSFGPLHKADPFEIYMVFRAGSVAEPNAFYGILGDCGLSSSAKTGIGVWFDDRSSQSRDRQLATVIGAGLSSSPPNRAVLDGATSAGTVPGGSPIGISMLYDPGNATYADRLELRPAFVATPEKPNIHTATAVTTDGSSHTFDIGAGGNNVGALTGLICEILVVLGAPDETRRLALESYLSSKWNV